MASGAVVAAGAGASVRCKGVLVGEGVVSLLPGCDEVAGRSRRGGIGTLPAEVSGDRPPTAFRTGMGMATGMAEGWPAGRTPRDAERAASPPPPGTASAPGTVVAPAVALPPGTPVPPPPAPLALPAPPDAVSVTADLGCPPRRAPDGTEDGVTGSAADGADGADGVTDGPAAGPAAEATGGAPGDMADAALGASFRGVADDVSLPEAG
ncbi:hypothetical protein RB199_25730 [Streptomyces libani]|uniref:hypothetical protein n=1 Tax=Streptomyces nigrescens TaxID=1920 RepID=UPI00304806E9